MKMTEREAFIAYLKTKGILKIDWNCLGVITNVVKEDSCALGYNDLELMQEVWEAKAQAVPEGFCIVPKEMNNFDAYCLAHRDFKQNKILFDMENRGLSDIEVELRKLKWLLWKVYEIKKAYKNFVGWISESGAKP
ncbi:hypothetical protein [Acinetobacter pittii]|uniref:hypothetical protein n=1 Tax=Acinetobacter pittii TaxID=48296 RepID=UPI000838474A|nr:hypothetical protein [Acinetobacter pittii]OCY90863.1 hypothetical protein BFR67_08325 [Acinetobacter pittii]